MINKNEEIQETRDKDNRNENIDRNDAFENNKKINKNASNYLNISNRINTDSEKIQNEGQIELPGALNGNSWTFKHSKWSECDRKCNGMLRLN